MRITVVGGGPAGLYFALLMQQADPAHRITVHERNRADDTYGFGVVFSDETLNAYRQYDAASFQAITDAFAYWDQIDVHLHGEVVRSAGHGFAGLARRQLLQILQRRCGALGVDLRFRSELAPGIVEADLVVIADGANSPWRERFREHFQPKLDLRPNRFAWMGSTTPLPAFTFIFRDTEHGIWNAHAYQYAPGMATWIFETTDRTWREAGLDRADEAASAAYLEHVFADDLKGHRLITDRSLWRQFPIVRCARWTHGSMVLLGDAAHTAHFSIGSGTKLAMEDAIALFEAFRARRGVPEALAHYEARRRDEVERTQHAAETSLVWFETVRRYWSMPPLQFAYSLLSRSKQITHENLRLRDPGFVDRVERWFAGSQPPPAPMFTPLRLRGLALANRVVVSPMAQYSAANGTPDDWHLVHLGSRAIGGAGLVYTEMTCVAADARITPGCTGMYARAHVAAWRRIVDFVHARSDAKLCLQLGHAGRKGSTRRGWEGMDQPLETGNWPLISASAIAYQPGNQLPRAMSRRDMQRVVGQFVRATNMAIEAGFDMLELHMAHGYLLASFLSPLTNTRGDAYGGSLENRLRFPLQLFDAVRAAWPDERPLAVRISAVDWMPDGNTEADAVVIARAFRAHGCDLIDVSAGQTVPEQQPIYGRMFQTPFADAIRNEAGIATMAVGNITSADQVNTILAAGRADLVALARPHLADPYFALNAAAEHGNHATRWPEPYLPGREQASTLRSRAREELANLRRATRPPSPNRRA